MNNLSLRWKTILGVAGIEFVLLVLLVSLTIGQLRDSSNDGLVKRASTVATLFASTSKDATLSYDLASLEASVAEVMTNPDIVYARVIGSNGRELAAAGNPPTGIKQFRADSSLESVTNGVFSASSPITEGGESFGSVQIGIDTVQIAENLAGLKRWSYFIVALELVLVALFSYMLGTYLTSQLATLRQAARKVADDSLDIDLEIRSEDEIGEVAMAFNRMVDRLQDSREKRDHYEKQLKKLNATLEQRVEQRTKQLSNSLQRLETAKAALEHETDVRLKAEFQMRQAQKLESVGQLAAGVAHEINTPVRNIGDSLNFVRDAVGELTQHCSDLKEIALSARHPADAQEMVARVNAVQEKCDIDYLSENAPIAIESALQGVDRVTEIVSAMKSFRVNGNSVKEPASINQAIERTVTVSRHEHRRVAHIALDLDPDIPKLYFRVSDVTHAILHVLVNAAHAVQDRYGESSEGVILIRSAQEGNEVVVTITDNGAGMSDEVREKVFDRFFTTKGVGRGSGQGLSIAYDTIVNSHGGSIHVESQIHEGTSFTFRLPINRFEFREYLKANSAVAVV